MRPDHLGLRIEIEQRKQGLLVGVGVEKQIVIDPEVDRLLDPRSARLGAEEVEFADAAVIAPPVLGLDQFVDGRVIEPALHVVQDAIRANERHDPQAWRLGLDQQSRAVIWQAVRQDPGYSIAAENIERLVNRVYRDRVIVIVKVRIEDFYLRLLRERADRDSDRKYRR